MTLYLINVSHGYEHGSCVVDVYFFKTGIKMNESLNISNTLLNDTISLPRTETNIRIASSTEKVIYILLGCIGIIGNLLVVVAVVSVKSGAKHYADLLIVNQSSIDLLSSVFIIATTLTVDTSSRKLSGFVDEL